MAVSGAGAAEAGEAPAEAQEGAQGTQEGQEQQSPNAELLARMDQLQSQWGEFRESFSQEQGEEGEQQQPPEGPGRVLMDPTTGTLYDTFTGQEVENEYGEEMSPEQITQLVEQRAADIADQRVAPLNNYVRAQQYAALEEAYPAMRDEATAQKVVDEARQLSRTIGSPEAWRSPEFLEQVFLARDARERASGQEAPATGQQSSALEDPSAAPGGQQSGQTADDIGDAIVSAGGDSKARAFFGVR